MLLSRNNSRSWGLWVILFGLALLALLDFAKAQTASPVPNGETQFSDANGAPYSGGMVYFYIPGTTTPKNTWKDPYQTTLNSNPVVLDSAGRAIINGQGQYREILLDQYGNTIWDQLTYAYNPNAANLYAPGTLGGNYTGSTGPLLSVTVGSGLTLSGAGVLTANGANWPIVYDGGSQTVSSSFSFTQRIATTSGIVYTLGRGSTLGNGFGVFIYAQGGNVTITPNAVDQIYGTSGVGQSLLIPSGETIFISSDGQSAATWQYWVVGNPNSNAPPGGRLSTVSTSQFSTPSATGVSSLFYVPDVSNSAPYWNGSNWQSSTFPIVTDLLSSTSYSPAAVANNTVYDEFLWKDSTNTWRLTHVAWTSATARNVVISNTSGFITNATAITGTCSVACPGAAAGLWLGTFVSDAAAATVTFNPQPAAASGGALASVNLWNFYNRRLVDARSQDNKTSWSVAGTTFAASDGSNTNRVNFVIGLNDDSQSAFFAEPFSSSASGTAGLACGIGLNSTSTAQLAAIYLFAVASSTQLPTCHVGPVVTNSAIGVNYFQALEAYANSVATGYGNVNGGGAGPSAQGHQLSAQLRY